MPSGVSSTHVMRLSVPPGPGSWLVAVIVTSVSGVSEYSSVSPPNCASSQSAPLSTSTAVVASLSSLYPSGGDVSVT